MLSCFILRILSVRWVVVPPSYEEEAKHRKVLIERTADLLVNTLVIPDPSRLLPLPPSSEPFVTHPTCLVRGVHSMGIMIGIPRCEGGCCDRRSQPEVVQPATVTAAPWLFLCGSCHSQGSLIQVLYVGLGCLPSDFDLCSRQHQSNPLNLLWQLLPFFSYPCRKQI